MSLDFWFRPRFWQFSMWDLVFPFPLGFLISPLFFVSPLRLALTIVLIAIATGTASALASKLLREGASK